jgi:hypothetical protein
MRKLFIKKSLEVAPGYPLSFHTGRVRLMEKEWNSLIKKASDKEALTNKEDNNE